MNFKLSNMQLSIIVVAALAVLLLLAWPCLKTEYEQEKHKEAYTSQSASDANSEPVQMQRLTAQSPGYGTNFHIVGCKTYPCSNDVNDITKMACGVDDWSIWNDGSNKQFLENPTYGDGCDKSLCHVGVHPDAHDGMAYNDLKCCK